MIPKLPEEGDEGFDSSVKQSVREPRGDSCEVSVAAHAPVAHILGLPCIQFYRKPKWWRYPLVHQRNVAIVLSHESIHCVLLELGEDEERGFDALFGTVKSSRRLLS